MNLASQAAAFVVFLLCVLAPLVILFLLVPGWRNRSLATRVPMALLLATGSCIQLYYVRRFFTGSVFDVAVCVVLPATAFLLVRRASGFATPDLVRVAMTTRWTVLAVAVAAFAIRLGFEARVQGGLGYWGLYGFDFLNLCGVVTCVRESGFPAQSAVVEAGPLNYHWLFFVVPAWISEFLGSGMRVTTALAFFGATAAVMLITTLRLATAHAAGRETPSGQTDLCLMVVFLGCITTYGAQRLFASSPTLNDWLGSRNALLLSPLNCILNFPNVTIALMAAVTVVGLLDEWEASLRPPTAVALAAASVAAAAGCVLFVPPIALAGAGLVLLGFVRKPLRFALLVAPFLAVSAVFFRGAGYWGGAVAEGLAVSLDGGRFLLRLTMSAAPIFVLLPFAFRRARVGPADLAIAAAAMFVPSVFLITGSPTSASDLSMKSAALFATVLVPRCAAGLTCVAERYRLKAWPAAAVALVVVVGLSNSVIYLVQFPLARLGILTGRWRTVSPGLYASLRFVRESTPRGTVILSDAWSERTDFDPVVSLGERRVWLGRAYEKFKLYGEAPEGTRVSDRREAWKSFLMDPGSGGAQEAWLAVRAGAYVIVRRGQFAGWVGLRRVGEFGDTVVLKKSLSKE